jgi:hypothetical protein
MEVAAQHLTTLSVVYDKASELEGEAHRQAFIALFRDTLNMMYPFVAGARHASLYTLRRGLFREGKKAQRVPLDMGSFWRELDRVANALYEDKAAEHEIIFEAETAWRVLVSADPIFFSLSPCAAGLAHP